MIAIASILKKWTKKPLYPKWRTHLAASWMFHLKRRRFNECREQNGPSYADTVSFLTLGFAVLKFPLPHSLSLDTPTQWVWLQSCLPMPRSRPYGPLIAGASVRRWPSCARSPPPMPSTSTATTRTGPFILWIVTKESCSPVNPPLHHQTLPPQLPPPLPLMGTPYFPYLLHIFSWASIISACFALCAYICIESKSCIFWCLYVLLHFSSMLDCWNFRFVPFLPVFEGFSWLYYLRISWFCLFCKCYHFSARLVCGEIT